MAESALSRRLSEFTGVALFAAALIWLIALVTLLAERPGLVLQRRVGRRRRRTSPAASAPSWRCRRSSWSATRPSCSRSCSASSAGTTSGARDVDARLHEARRRRRCSSDLRRGAAGARLQRLRRRAPVTSRRRRARRRRSPPASAVVSQPHRRGDSAADAARARRSSCRPSSRSASAFSVVAKRVRGQRGLLDALPGLARRAAARARTAADRRQARQEGRARSRRRKSPTKVADAAEKLKAARARKPRQSRTTTKTTTTSADAAGGEAAGDPTRRPDARPAAAAARRRRDVEDAGRAPPGRLRAAAGDAARRAEGPAQDRRARADGRRAAARREMPRVLRRGHGRPDSPGPGRHDLRVQARRRREVQPHHRPGRRPLPRDAGRVGADRSHPRQVHGRHPDSERAPRADHAARAARSRRPTRARRRS